jgi:hypothetical protein
MTGGGPGIIESDALRKMFSIQPRYDEQDREYFYGSVAFNELLFSIHVFREFIRGFRNLHFVGPS